MDINDIYKTIDDYFDKNQAAEAERYMNRMLDKALEEKNQGLALSLLNELIGYYRQASQKEELIRVIEQSFSLSREMGIEHTVPFATTLLNAATGYRSVGMYEEAAQCYARCEDIYAGQVEEGDMLYAGLYNNRSLLLQEVGEYSDALNYQQKALAIALANGQGFEIAVSYTNLAGTYAAMKDYANAEKNAEQAIEIFRERGVADPHYSSAVGVLGLCRYHEGRVEEARRHFLHGMEVIEKSIGRNAQYERMKSYYEMCGEAESPNKEDNGLSVCRAFYEQCGKQMIAEKFKEYEDKIAVGLCGEGSDCFGFDDEYSRDHDWGPSFCLWVTDETYAVIGEALEREYANLPSEFMGYQRTESAEGANRTGVMTIGSFYERLLGVRLACKEDVAGLDYTAAADYALAAAVNGEVFCDEEGCFTEIREALKQGFPSGIRYRKLAQSMTLFSQCGQYNLERMWKRGDFLTMDKMLLDAIYEALRCCHYAAGVYPPHEKWLYRSAKQLSGMEEALSHIDALSLCVGGHEEADVRQIIAQMEALGDRLARILYGTNIISDINPYLAYHKEELLYKSQYADMEFEALVDAIVKLEFQAFDKVKNEGGRAYCQNDWPTFYVMRKSQYLTWNRDMLLQYIYDFDRELSIGHNLITEKYGRMMESTAPERYAEICDNFPEISPQKKAVIEQIVAIQMEMMEAFALDHKNVADNARSLHTYEDNPEDTSYETYLRGEISTYSDKMLQLYGAYVADKAGRQENIARLTIENTARLYGYDNLQEFEKRVIDA